MATWCEELTHWKIPWCWERLKAGEGDDRGWDHWMASPTQWTWVWAGFGNWHSWCAAVHGITNSRTPLSYWTEHIYIRIYTHIYIYTHMCIYIQVCMLWLKISKHWFNRVSLNNVTFLKTLVALGKYHCLHIPIFWWNEKRMNIFILYRVVNVLYKVSCKLRNIIIQ